MVRGHLTQKLLVDLVHRRPAGARDTWALLKADLRGDA
jgi:hypothetical protein